MIETNVLSVEKEHNKRILYISHRYINPASYAE